jgi:hypothetical protein
VCEVGNSGLPDDHEAALWAVVEDAVRQSPSGSRKVSRLMHRPSAYRTSFAITELDVELDDGTVLRLLLKELGRGSLSGDSRRAKPRFLHNPLREIRTYLQILEPEGLGTAVCFGVVIDPKIDRYWLLLERVDGVGLFQVGDFDEWRQVAAWLARFHARYAGTIKSLTQKAPLLRYDATYYRRWPDRARAILARGPAQPHGDAGDAWERLIDGYETVIARLTALPATLIHGEFYASNVLVQQRVEGLRVCPIDWETAALGSGLVDLAALTAGSWSEGERVELAHAYHGALTAAGGGSAGFDSLLADLDVCHLHLAVQWLGWSPAWSPPAEHAQDWLGEALRLARKLGL